MPTKGKLAEKDEADKTDKKDDEEDDEDDEGPEIEATTTSLLYHGKTANRTRRTVRTMRTTCATLKSRTSVDGLLERPTTWSIISLSGTNMQGEKEEGVVNTATLCERSLHTCVHQP